MINTRIVESVLAEVFKRAMMVADEREIVRRQLEEVRRLEQLEAERIERERRAEQIRKKKREMEERDLLINSLISSMIDDVYYGSLANKRQRTIDLCKSIIESEISSAWPTISRKLLIRERINALSEQTQVLLIDFMGKLGELSGRDLKKLVDSIGKGNNFVISSNQNNNNNNNLISSNYNSSNLISSNYNSSNLISGNLNSSNLNSSNLNSSNLNSSNLNSGGSGVVPMPPPMPVMNTSKAVVTSQSAPNLPSVREQLQAKANERKKKVIDFVDPEEVRRRENEINKYSGVAKDLFLSLQKKFDVSHDIDSDVEDLGDSDFSDD